jgi:hypothetical protein
MKAISTPTRTSFLLKCILILAIFSTIVESTVAQCTCTGNLVLNPSFENGTSSWSWSGGNLNAGTGAIKCGSFSGDFQITNTANNWVSQTIGTDLPAGTIINASVWAGTHNNSFWHGVVIDFFDSNWNWISASSVTVDKVLSAAPAGPQQYTWTGVVPLGCKYTNIGFSGGGDWIKTDAWCVTASPATTVSVGNTVFIDINGNGINDGGDWGYDGATVRIYADNNDDGIADGAALATQTTQSGGLYNFTGLAPGKYFVQIEDVPYWMFKAVPNGGDPDNNTDNDNNGLTQNTTINIIKGATITLSLGGEPQTNHNPTYDFGIFKTNGLGDMVFLDADADGIQDAGEAGIAGVTVNLRNTSGALLASTATDATGYYYFYDPSQYGTYNYNIEFITPAGFSPSLSNQGTDDTKDSDPVGGTITNVTVPAGVWDYSFDAGFSPLMAVGNRVYHDVNNNGFRDATEVGIATVAVKLYRDANNDNVADGAFIASTVTNATGIYLFSNLTPGNYIVGIMPPANYYSSTINAGDPDSDIDLDNNGMTIDTITREIRGYAITLSPFAEFDGTNNNTNTNITYDFALTTGTIKLGDYVWNDINKNGEQDAGEPGIANQWVVLKSADKSGEITKMKTDANGYYLFENMAPGNYFMKFPGLVNMVPTIERTGNQARNSKANSGGWAPITLIAGMDDMDIDAGYYTGWALPVQDIKLNAVLNGNKVGLNWQTINEINTSYFEAERSYDGIAFEKISKVYSVVPNGGNAAYTSTDKDFLNTATALFYRIKIVDKDGKITYSKTVPVKLNKSDEISVWPNPFINSVSFTYKTGKAVTLNVRLLNISGQKIQEQQFKIDAGTSNLVINNLKNIPTGNYLLELHNMNTGDKQVKRIIK